MMTNTDIHKIKSKLKSIYSSSLPPPQLQLSHLSIAGESHHLTHHHYTNTTITITTTTLTTITVKHTKTHQNLIQLKSLLPPNVVPRSESTVQNTQQRQQISLQSSQENVGNVYLPIPNSCHQEHSDHNNIVISIMNILIKHHHHQEQHYHDKHLDYHHYPSLQQHDDHQSVQLVTMVQS